MYTSSFHPAPHLKGNLVTFSISQNSVRLCCLFATILKGLFYLCVEQRMQQTDQHEQEELQALQEELQTLRQQREREREEQGRQDQEVLALLTHQAEQAEESARQLTVKLQEKVSIQRSHRCFFCKKDDPQVTLWLMLHANYFSHLLCLV